MTPEEHKEIHKELHTALDMLVADWILHTGLLPSQTPVYDLIRWSYEQTLEPTKRQ